MAFRLEEGARSSAKSSFVSAEQSLRKLISDYPSDAGMFFWLSALGVTEAGLERRSEALEATERAVQLCDDPLERPDILTNQAVVFCWLGERDRTLEELEMVSKVPHGVPYGNLRFGPSWDSLRGDPRFEQIVESLKPKS